MIWRIARKEYLEMVRDGRFRAGATVVLGLLVVSLLMGWKHYSDVSAQHAAAQRATRTQWLAQEPKNPHSAAHYGVYAFKPKLPLSFVDQGVDDYVGVAVWLEAHKQNDFRYRPAQDATAVQRFGELTAATVLQLLLPLVIILLGFGAFAGEREQGTLRQLLSLGVPAPTLALGKALGMLVALGLLLVPATILGVGALALAAGPGGLAASLPRLALLSAAYLGYYLLFVGVCLAVSAWAKSARLALVALLGFWIVQGLVAPRLVTDLARGLYPVPSALTFTETVATDMAGGIDGHNSQDARRAALEKRVLQQYAASRVEDLPVNFAGIALQEGEEYGYRVYDRRFGELWRRFEEQNAVHQLGGFVAPLLAVRSLSMGLSGTDFAQHRHFATAAEQYRRGLIKTMNEAMTRNKDDGYRATAADYRSVSDFQYTTPPLGWVLAQQSLSLLGLGFWIVLAAAAAVFAAARLRVTG
ncbi:ABC transporter permease [Gloeobacter violaceus]|uniref:Glr3105 protein n=1 Tax=Gloeobacter violaceus (strain ATCC 29082 / PCC 7421) TaxID=251221 RepID=Q7NGR3_GLOVI|nr:DUF3526 domain-containing protein [Gloeobacter violaceus]BAC91046.1 glr3105 [Gloeobacter violaceus PCC 7421]